MSHSRVPKGAGAGALAVALAGGVFLMQTPSEAAKKPGGGCNEGVLAPASAMFQDLATDGLQSDGRGTYVHCQDGQVSIGRAEGRFRIDTKKYNPNGARMEVHLAGDSCSGGPCPSLDLTNTHAILQTQTWYACSDPEDASTCVAEIGSVLDLRTMAENDVRRTRLMVSFYEGKKESTLSFQNASEGVVDGNQPCAGEPLKVTCVSATGGSCTSWVMEGDRACYVKATNPGRVFQGVYDAHFFLEVELSP
jgi:hypothetical protein